MLMMAVTSLSVGVRVAGDLTQFVLPRNCTLPCRKSARFMTLLENQSEVTIEVREGTRPLTCHQELVMKFALPLTTHARKRHHVIDVTFDMDANDCLTVIARDVTTGSEARQSMPSLNRRRYTHEQIERLVNDGEEFEEVDASKVELVSAQQVRWAEEYNRKLQGMYRNTHLALITTLISFGTRICL